MRLGLILGRLAPTGGWRRLARPLACGLLCLGLAHCANNGNVDPRYGVSPSTRLVEPGDPVPKGGGVYRVGSPYVVGGRVYVPENDPHYHAEGMASWYGSDFRGRATANGEIFDSESISAAHPTMPLPSYARVTNLRNGKSLIVRVNDRGPYAANRIIDVSKHAAQLLDFANRGTTMVRVEYVGPAQLDGSDDRLLEATLREGEPAPSPSTVRLAATRIVPAAFTAPAPRTHVASASASIPAVLTAGADDGPELVLTARGLY